MTPLNLPLHPLFVHGAVVFIPLAALVAMAFVLRADWRWALRWPTLLINAAGFVALDAAHHQHDRTLAVAQAMEGEIRPGF